MNDVMQIESTCNINNVAQHIPQSTASASTIIENGGVPAPVAPQTAVSSITSSMSAAGSNITAISASATPMVFTVNQQQASTGAPVLKLVSPVEGGAPQLIKVVPASAVLNPAAAASGGSGDQVGPNSTNPTYTISDCLSQIASSASTTTIYQNTGTVAVLQKMNDGQNGHNQPTEGNVVSQRVYSIVSANQQKPHQQQINATVVNSPVVPKIPFNNGQQRVHTLTTLPTNARVIPVSAAAATVNPQKVQILSNVVVSKQNIVLNKTTLQAQRQIISNMIQKQTNVVAKPIIDSGKSQPPVQQQQTIQTQVQVQAQAQPIQTQLVPQKIQTVNNVVITTNQALKPVLNNAINQKILKPTNAVNRSIQQPVVQPPKTVKTLSPGSPQPNFIQKTSGVKTLTPNMTNHYHKMANTNKIMPQAPTSPRVGGIKTLNAKNMVMPNNRSNNMAPKPNYIGKHANQAQKAQQKTGKTRGISAQKANNALNPKYNHQKSIVNSQSNFTHQTLTAAQIMQSMTSAAKHVSDSFTTTKNYPLQSPPDDASLSEDIGEEVHPDISPNHSYLCQLVMLDHNYVAPPPPLSPSPVMSRSSSAQHTSQISGSGALNGALLAAAGREREREKEREEKMAAAAALYYNVTGNTNKRNRRHSGGPPPVQQSPQSYSSQTSNILPISPMEVRNNMIPTSSLSIQDDDAGSTISSEGGHGDDGEGEETETAPEGEGDDDGITRCICDFDHDDGYMISCDICLSWQHVDCMGLDRSAIPDKYQCVRCQPRRVDRQHARAIQIRKREDFMKMGTLPKDNTNTTGVVGSGSGNASDTSSETSNADSTGDAHHTTHYGRHSTGKLSLNNNLIGKKRGTPVSLSTRRKSEPVGHNRRGPLAHKRQQRRESAKEASVNNVGRRTAVKKREKKVKTIKRKIKSRSSIEEDSQDSWHGAATTFPNNMGSSLIQLRQWIENYEEAVTNHYSPELRARISNVRANGIHNEKLTPTGNQQPGADKQAPPTAQADVAVQKCKVSGQPLTGMKIVLASQSLPLNAPVIELRGKYMLSTQHRTSSGTGSGGGSGGLQTRQHSQRPGPFLFFYRLPRDGTEVCVDTRTYGNDARFIRRSCKPNAELRHLVEKGTLHLYVITTTNVEKNTELTIKHESHDLAAVAAAASSANNTTQAAIAIAAAGIQCACGGGPQSCGLYNNRKNGGNVTDTTGAATVNNTDSTTHRKRRGRRATSPVRVETPPPPQEVTSPTLTSPSISNNQQQSSEELTVSPPPPPALSTRRASSHQRAAAAAAAAAVTPASGTKTRESSVEREKDHKDKEKEYKDKDRDKDKEELKKEAAEAKDKKKKMTREERKMEAIMKAIERMEKADQRKQELQARQAQRRESDPVEPHHSPHKQNNVSKNQENGETEQEIIRIRRKKRKGRARTISTNSQQPSARRRTRVNSTDSYLTSGDESSLLSPPLPLNTQEPVHEQRHTRSMKSQDSNENLENVPRECITPEPNIQNKIMDTPGSQISDISSVGQVNTAAGLLLALANGGSSNSSGGGGGIHSSELQKSPEVDANSSGSSPITQLSSACLLVAAAVEPLEPGFKFPKTKKTIINEWLKAPDPIQSSMSLHTSNNLMELQSEQPIQQQSMDFYGGASTTNKSLATLVQAASLCDSPPQTAGGKNMTGQGVGNAKKRWLRQAISEECDSPCSRPETPPGASEMVAPPKKRRLARESLSSEQSFTPPTTPTMLVPPSSSMADDDYPNNDEEFYTNEDRNTLSDSSPPTVDDTVSGKDTNIHSQRHNVDIGFSCGNAMIGTVDGYHQRGHDEVDSEISLKERVNMQLEFGGMQREDDIVKKDPEILPSTLLDPRLGRDSLPIFCDSAQLLGNIEKSIRFYEETLTASQQQTLPASIIPSSLPIIAHNSSSIHSPTQTTLHQQPQQQQQQTIEEMPLSPLPQTQNIINEVPIIKMSSVQSQSTIKSSTIHVKERISMKLEMVTPAKRKLSISEYRQRKQLKTPVDRGSGSCTPERMNSPETPPPTSTSSSNNSNITATSPGNSTSSAVNNVTARSRSRSVSTSSTSSLSSDEEIISGTNVNNDNVDVKPSAAESQVLVAFNSAPTAVERQRENVERLKKAFGLTLDDDTRRSAINCTIKEVNSVSPAPKLALKSPPNLPTVNNTLTTSDLLAKIEPSSITKLVLGLDKTKFSSDTKFSTDSKFATKLTRSPSPEKILVKNPSPEPEVTDTTENEVTPDDTQSNRDKEIEEAYSKFEETVSQVYIPSFNNPVYPNSTQYTGFSSVIDSSPYEGRNPSPPPSELLKSTCYK